MNPGSLGWAGWVGVGLGSLGLAGWVGRSLGFLGAVGLALVARRLRSCTRWWN